MRVGNPYITQLMNLGLSDKEARVYLASLELGSAVVQEIAKKSSVKRATTYVAIESLVDRGLMSSFKKGKKSYFSATDPEQLGSFISEQKEELIRKEKAAQSIIGDLHALAAKASGASEVSYYEGWDGINSLREDIIRSDAKIARELVPLDEARKLSDAKEIKSDIKKKFRGKVTFKTLYTSNKGAILPPKSETSEARFIAREKFPVSCEVVIYGIKVVFIMYSGKPSGILIADERVAETVSAMFDSLWVTAK